MQFFKKPGRTRVTDPLEPIPVGETQDSDWAAWEDSVGFQDPPAAAFPDTVKQAISPADGHFIDAFASVRKK